MKKQTILLALIILFSFIVRIVISFHSDYFADDDSYSNLRLIEMMRDKTNLITYDPLSYGGRDVITPQLFHGIMAILAFIPFSLKLFPEIFISTLPLIIYICIFSQSRKVHMSFSSVPLIYCLRC